MKFTNLAALAAALLPASCGGSTAEDDQGDCDRWMPAPQAASAPAAQRSAFRWPEHCAATGDCK